MLFDSIWALFPCEHVVGIYRHAAESRNQGRAAYEIKKGRRAGNGSNMPSCQPQAAFHCLQANSDSLSLLY